MAERRIAALQVCRDEIRLLVRRYGGFLSVLHSPDAGPLTIGSSYLQVRSVAPSYLFWKDPLLHFRTAECRKICDAVDLVVSTENTKFDDHVLPDSDGHQSVRKSIAIVACKGAEMDSLLLGAPL